MKNKFFIPLCFVVFFSCKKINIYEKRIAIPNFKWEKSFIPKFTFENTISNKLNVVSAIIRHTNKYPYSNIWVKFTAISKNDTITKDINIPLTKNNQNREWANEGMSDIYEFKFPISSFPKDVGDYTFTLENIMRDNPLTEVLHIGLRIDRDPVK